MVEVQGYDSYLVKMDGTGRVSKRNRAFLRPIRTYSELLKGKKSVLSQQVALSATPGGLGGHSYSAERSAPLEGQHDTGAHVVVRSEPGQEAERDRGPVVEDGPRNTSPANTRISLPSILPPDEADTAGARHSDGPQNNRRRKEADNACDDVTPVTRGRPVRARRKPDFLVVGNVDDPRFNRYIDG